MSRKKGREGAKRATALLLVRVACGTVDGGAQGAEVDKSERETGENGGEIGGKRNFAKRPGSKAAKTEALKRRKPMYVQCKRLWHSAMREKVGLFPNERSGRTNQKKKQWPQNTISGEKNALREKWGFQPMKKDPNTP